MTEQLAEVRLARPLSAWIAERRQARPRPIAWRLIAAELEQRAAVKISHETLRAWYPDPAEPEQVAS